MLLCNWGYLNKRKKKTRGHKFLRTKRMIRKARLMCFDMCWNKQKVRGIISFCRGREVKLSSVGISKVVKGSQLLPWEKSLD
jgi:hypothetical protein